MAPPPTPPSQHPNLIGPRLGVAVVGGDLKANPLIRSQLVGVHQIVRMDEYICATAITRNEAKAAILVIMKDSSNHARRP